MAPIISHLDFLADSIAIRNYGDWLAEFYPKDPNGTTQVLRFSRRGTVTGPVDIYVGQALLADDDGTPLVSDPDPITGLPGPFLMSDDPVDPTLDTIPANTAFRKRLIQAPTLTQTLWQPGRILSNSLPSFGSIKLTNQDGGLDQYRQTNGWIWAGQPYRVFFCDSRTQNIQSTVGKISNGLMGEPDFSISEINLPLLGLESLFNVPLSDHVYRGTSYMLEIAGDRAVEFSTPAALDLTGDMSLEGWFWIESQATLDRYFWGWVDSTLSPWRFGFTSTGAIFIACTIGGIQEIKISTKLLSIHRFYHITVLLDGRDVIFKIFDDEGDEDQILTTETYVNFFSSATRQAHSGGAYRIRTNSDATLNIWVDELRVFNFVRSDAETETDRYKSITGSVPVSCVHCLGFDDGTGTVATDSSATAAHGTITGTGSPVWFWAQEGGPELAGSPKPDVWGEAFGCKPILVDALRLGYQVAGGGSIQSLLPFEGGLSPTLDADSTTLRGYLTTTPAAGHCLRYPPRGLFKLGSQPTKPLSATVIGYNGGSLGYSNLSGGIIRKIVTERGPKLIDPNSLDVLSFDSYAAAQTSLGIMGMYIANPTDENSSGIGKTIDTFTLSASGFWGYVRASSLFHLEQFSGPSVTPDPDYLFDQRRIVDFTPMPPLQVIYGVVVKYRHNNVVHTEAEVAADPAFRALGTWKQLTMEWQEVRVIDSEVRGKYPGKASMLITVETALQYQADAQILAGYLKDLLVGPKEGWTVTLSSIGLQIRAGQTCTVRVNIQNMEDDNGDGIDRLGLDGSKIYSIVGIEDNKQGGVVKLSLWGQSDSA